jgi:hypothetical protein
VQAEQFLAAQAQQHVNLVVTRHRIAALLQETPLS